MIEVLRAGLCDLVMDPGRPGRGALGVPAGGAADPAALAAANRLVGNDEAAAGLEITLSGPTLRFPAGGVAALTGARFAAVRSSSAASAWNETLVLAAGETLNLGQARDGCRCWLALRGGLAVPQVLGSRSSFLPAGFGGHLGRALQAGDALACEPGTGEIRLLRAHPPSYAWAAPLRVLAGPQAGLFDDAGLAAFFAGRYRVDTRSDRCGLRLTGQFDEPALERLRLHAFVAQQGRSTLTELQALLAHDDGISVGEAFGPSGRIERVSAHGARDQPRRCREVLLCANVDDRRRGRQADEASELGSRNFGWRWHGASFLE